MMESGANKSMSKKSDQTTTSDAKDDLKSLPMPEVEKKLSSSPDGLSQAEAQKRLAPTTAAPSQPRPATLVRSFPTLGFLLTSRPLLTIELEGLRSNRRLRWEAEAARTGRRIFSPVTGAGRQNDRPAHWHRWRYRKADQESLQDRRAASRARRSCQAPCHRRSRRKACLHEDSRWPRD